jgi:hypothetical protein
MLCGHCVELASSPCLGKGITQNELAGIGDLFLVAVYHPAVWREELDTEKGQNLP